MTIEKDRFCEALLTSSFEMEELRNQEFLGKHLAQAW